MPSGGRPCCPCPNSSCLPPDPPTYSSNFLIMRMIVVVIIFLLNTLSTSSNNGENDDDTGDKENIIRKMLAHFCNSLVIQRSNYFCSTLMFSTRRLDEMLSDDDMRTLFSSTQSVPVRLSSCCRDRSVCLSSSNFLLCSHLLMVPMASQPLMASLAYVHNTHMCPVTHRYTDLHSAHIRERRHAWS